MNPLTTDFCSDQLQIIFVYVEMDNEEIGRPVSDYFGVTGDAPKVLSPTFSKTVPFMHLCCYSEQLLFDMCRK